MPSKRTRKTPLTTTTHPATRLKEARSRKASQAKISTFHTLLKRRHQINRDLAASNDCSQLQDDLAKIDSEIAALGGLESYQAASIRGQEHDRGGDSAKVLIGWMKELAYHTRGERLRLLEIGALTPDNYGSCARWLENEPIDLHSQHPGIKEQDFFERTPEKDHLFDVISCSLVLNFVPDPAQRGVMLQLMRKHLKPNQSSLLFLVLPLPCVSNSRYMDNDTLIAIMKDIGYVLVKERWKRGGKVGYWLWSLDPAAQTEADERWRRKVQLHDGPKMNNFAITLP